MGDRGDGGDGGDGDDGLLAVVVYSDRDEEVEKGVMW